MDNIIILDIYQHFVLANVIMHQDLSITFIFTNVFEKVY